MKVLVSEILPVEQTSIQPVPPPHLRDAWDRLELGHNLTT